MLSNVYAQPPLDHHRTRAIVVALASADHQRLRELCDEATECELAAAIDVANRVYWSVRLATEATPEALEKVSHDGTDNDGGEREDVSRAGHPTVSAGRGCILAAEPPAPSEHAGRSPGKAVRP